MFSNRKFVCLLLTSVIAIFLMVQCTSGSKQKPEIDRIILLIFDGLPIGAIERLPLPHLQDLIARGCYYESVEVILPEHPPRVNDLSDPHYYPWGRSLPNPVAMSGTVFVGQEIKNQLVQNVFVERPTAFVVNCSAYEEIAHGYTEYHPLQKSYEDLFKDHLVIEKAKEVIQRLDPIFIRIHLQGPGSAGYMVYAGSDMPQNGHLKYPSADKV